MRNFKLALVVVVVVAAVASATPKTDKFISSLNALLIETFDDGFKAGWDAREERYVEELAQRL